MLETNSRKSYIFASPSDTLIDPGCYDIVDRKLQREINLSSIDTTTIGSRFSSTAWNVSVTETNE